MIYSNYSAVVCSAAVVCIVWGAMQHSTTTEHIALKIYREAYSTRRLLSNIHSTSAVWCLPIRSTDLHLFCTNTHSVKM